MINVPQELYIKCYHLIYITEMTNKNVLETCSLGRGPQAGVFQGRGQGFSGGRVFLDTHQWHIRYLRLSLQARPALFGNFDR